MTTRGASFRRRLTSPGVRSAARKLAWLALNFSSSSQANGSNVVLTAIDALTTPLASKATVLRIRGELSTRLQSTGNISGGNWGAGLTVVNQQAGTQVPQPVNNAGADWIWHHVTAAQGNGTDEVNEVQKVVIDNKSKRKLILRDMVLCLDNRSGKIMDFRGFLRLLIAIA